MKSITLLIEDDSCHQTTTRIQSVKNEINLEMIVANNRDNLIKKLHEKDTCVFDSVFQVENRTGEPLAKEDIMTALAEWFPKTIANL